MPPVDKSPTAPRKAGVWLKQTSYENQIGTASLTWVLNPNKIQGHMHSL